MLGLKNGVMYQFVTSIIHLSDLESIYIGIRFKELESNENASKQIELPFMEVNLETMTAKVFS